MSIEDRFSALQHAPNTRRTYRSRLVPVGGAGKRSAGDIVHWVATTTRGAPLGTALPTRAAALHYLVGELGLSESQAKSMLPRLRNRQVAVRHAPLPDDYVRFRAAVGRLSPGPVRSLLLLLPLLGIRLEEACTLRAESVRFDGTGVQVRVLGKGAKVRDVFGGPDAAALLRPLVEHADGWLFPGRDKKRISQSAVRMTLYRMRKEDPTIPEVTPHQLRHWYAVTALRAGVDLASLQKLLGHASIATTAVYAQPDREMLVEAARKIEAGQRRRTT